MSELRTKKYVLNTRYDSGQGTTTAILHHSPFFSKNTNTRILFVCTYIYIGGFSLHNRNLQAVCGSYGTVRSVTESTRRLPDTFHQHDLPCNIRVCSLILTVSSAHRSPSYEEGQIREICVAVLFL